MGDRDRVMAVAAHAVRALRPDLVDGFARAFKRDITISNYRLAAVFDVLGIPHRRRLRSELLPGKVTCISQGDSDNPSAAVFAELFARGGTFIGEAESGVAFARACGLDVTTRALEPGRLDIGAGYVWIDPGAIAVSSGEAIVRDATGPVVARMPVGGGWFVHVGWITAPFKRDAPPGPQTTHRAFAESLGIEPRGVLATETPIDATQAAAATSMVRVYADLVARAV